MQIASALVFPAFFALSCAQEPAPPPPPRGRALARAAMPPGAAFTWDPEVLEASRLLASFSLDADPALLESATTTLRALIQPGVRHDHARFMLAYTLRLQGDTAGAEAVLAETDPLRRPVWDYFFTRPPTLLAPLLEALVAAGCAERPDLPASTCAGAHAPEVLPADYLVWEQVSWCSHSRDRIGQWSQARSGQTAAEIGARIGLHPGLDVADIGAGEGWFTLPFARVVGPGGTVYAQEVEAAYLDFITFSAEGLGLTNVRTVLGGPVDANLPEASVDLVFVCEVFKWIYTNRTATDRAQVEATALPFLRSLHGGLRPGGRLVIIEHDRPPDSPRDISPATIRGHAEEVGFRFVEELPDYLPLQRTLVLTRD